MRQYQLLDYEGDEVTCPECGEKFSGKSGFGRHYSLTHGEKFKPLAVCDMCGDIFRTTLPRLENAETHYCSEDCRSDGFSKQRTGQNSACWKEDIAKICEQCGGGFSVKPSLESQRFCSEDCYHAHNRKTGNLAGPNNPMWKEKNGKICEVCGEPFTPHIYRSGTARFCSWKCTNQWKSTLTGPDNPQWENGRNTYRAVKQSLGPMSWARISAEVRDEADDRCVMCGGTAEVNGRGMSAHHIIPVMSGGDNGDYNFMALCQSCHGKAESYTKAIPEVRTVLVE